MKYTLFFILIFFSACSNSALEHELANTKKALAEAQQQLSASKANSESEGKFIHIVYFKLKAGTDKNKIVEEIKKIEPIEVIKNLEIGYFKEMGDERAIADYALTMEVTLESDADYQSYQAHPLHLTLKENIKESLAGPPLTYDYIVQ